MENESDSDASCNRHTRYNNQMMGTVIGGFENKQMSGDHPNYSSVERLKYWEESWRLEGTCCYSDSCEMLE